MHQPWPHLPRPANGIDERSGGWQPLQETDQGLGRPFHSPASTNLQSSRFQTGLTDAPSLLLWNVFWFLNASLGVLAIALDGEKYYAVFGISQSRRHSN